MKVHATMYQAVRKLSQQTLTAANVCTTSSGCLFITDRVTKQWYLINTRSNLSVFPRRLLPECRVRINYSLYAANGTTIPTYRWISRSLNLGLRRDFTWRFIVVEVNLPIIGVDFLSHFSLLVDCRNNRLLEGITSLFTQGHTATPAVPSISHHE